MEETLQTALDAIIDQMPAAVVVAEAPSGRIVLANRHVTTVWRAPMGAQRRGFHHDGRPYAEEEWPLRRVLRDGVAIEREDIRIERGDGTPGVIRVSAAPVRDEHGTTIAAVAIYIDVTDEWQEQDALDLLAEASAVAAESLDLGQTLRSIARMSIPRFADIAFVYLLDSEGALTRYEVAATDPSLEQQVRAMWERFPIAAAPLQAVMAGSASRLTVEPRDDMWNFVTNAEHRQSLLSLHVRSSVTVPIRGSGTKPFGVMSFARTADQPYQTMDVLVAEELARRAAAAIERSRLYDAERAQRAQLEHLQALTGALAQAITTDEVLGALVAEMGDLVGAKVIVVALLDESGSQLRIARSSGLPADIEERFRVMPLDATFVVTRAVKENQPIWISGREEAATQSPLVRAAGLSIGEAWAAVPLSGSHGVIGVVALSFEHPQSFPDSLRNFILSVSRQSAQAIERARLFDSERKARKEAEHASRAKDDFLAILSHELRTPMTTVIGWTDLLRMTYNGEDDSIRTALEALRASALTQARLIDDLLDVSRIITGKLFIEKERVDLSTLVVRATETLRIHAEAKGLALKVVGDGPIAMNGDPARIEQIISNLVANAVKFTPRGGEIDVAVRRRDGHAEIVVRDTGEGIAPDFLPHVFERFRQASIGDSRLHAGLGLGLSIVNHLVQLHGGTVRAESDGLGKGATFTVTLPVEER